MASPVATAGVYDYGSLFHVRFLQAPGSAVPSETMDEKRYPFLAGLHDPKEIQGFSLPELEALADEARRFLIETISKTGGHLGAALGVA